MPRPVRAWGGEEFGKKSLTSFQRSQVELDDILMMRFWMLFIVSDLVAKAKEREAVDFVMEQPAAPEKKEEVVSIWRTSQWKVMEELYGFQRQTFNQSEFAAQATKPTTLGGTMAAVIPLCGRKGEPREVQGKSSQELCQESKALARWPPLLMRALAVQLVSKVWKRSVKMKQLSWAEHVAAGHTPFRKDCKICQQASAKDMPHRRSPLPPKVGTLSVDMSGPYHRPPDVHRGETAKFLLVGCFTWFAKDQEGEEVQDGPEEPEPPEDAPELDDEEAKKKEEEEKQDDRPKKGRPRHPEKPLFMREKALKSHFTRCLFQEGAERQDVKIEVHRICVLLKSRDKQVVLRAIIDIYLRLRSDGYTVAQLHSDQGGEFMSDALEDWCRSRNILKTTTPHDAPQTNGRAEVSVQQMKPAIKRVLHGAGVGTERWPLAARYVNEKARLRQVGKPDNSPNFLQKVLIRKRYWRVRELEPTQEEAKYIAPSWVNHGHWIERQGGEICLVRMVMKGLTEPAQDQDWIGIEDAMNPVEERRRLRGKVAVQALQVETSEEADEEVLQTRIVSMQEVRKDLEKWKESMKKELDAMVHEKKALKPISAREVQQLLKNDEVEVIPSKLVCTVKPSPDLPQGRLKTRLVACGNFSTSEGGLSDLFAGGASAVALRATVCAASQREWGGSTLDVKAAFLNAPMDVKIRGGEEEEQKIRRPIIKPPPILITAGLASPDEYWEAEKAVYGYRRSPRLWRDYRDSKVQRMRMKLGDKVLYFQQLVTEGDLWKVMVMHEDGSESPQDFLGLMLVYVDDIL